MRGLTLPISSRTMSVFVWLCCADGAAVAGRPPYHCDAARRRVEGNAPYRCFGPVAGAFCRPPLCASLLYGSVPFISVLRFEIAVSLWHFGVLRQQKL